MRFSFFRDRLCTQIPPSFDYSGVFRTASSPSPSPGVGPKPAEPPKFNAAQLQKELGITEAAAKLLTNGGTESVTEQQVHGRLNKAYDISRKSDSRPDSFEDFNNAALLKRVDSLDGQSGNIKVKDGNLDWEAAGATVTPATQNPPTPGNVINNAANTPPVNDFVSSGDAPLSQQTKDQDTATINNALKKAGIDPNQKIEYQGFVFTGTGGSSDVRFYRVGEGDNAKYVGINGDGQILSKEKLNAHLEELNTTRKAENKPKLDPGAEIVASLESGKYLDLKVSPPVPQETEA
jgi:hypothetical protein